MKSVVFALICVAAVSAMWTGEFQPTPGKIEGQYIVVFKKSLTASARDAHLIQFSSNMTIVARHAIGEFQAYSAQISESVLPLVNKAPEVAYVEQDGIATIQQASCGTASGLPAGLWGLTRIHQRARNLNGAYTYFETTDNVVRAYIVDTGILTTHVDFDGRAIIGANFVDAIVPDQNGHGTHVASTVGGRQYGVSKTATLVAVKVLGKTGSGSWTGVIQGVQWVTEDAAKFRGINPNVGNMSLGGGRNQALNDAVDASTNAGVAWVIASGNSNADACNFSPASAPSALAVGATQNLDGRATFSNWGRCQAVWAPGQNVLGAWMTSNTATNTISGTSMASPHACGVVANILSTRPANPPTTPSEAFGIVRSTGTNGLITDGKEAQGTPNILVFSLCGSAE